MFLIIILLTVFRLIFSIGNSSECDGISNRTVWNCSGSELTNILALSLDPDKVNNFRILDFAHNNLTRLQKLNLSSSNEVRELLLSYNEISEIDTDALEEMKRLETLDLSMNKITGDILNEKQFQNVFNIKKLNMSRNPLRRIHKDVFNIADFGSLEILDLSHCQISVIEEEALALLHLKILDLSFNELEKFSWRSLRHLRKLLKLDLSHNSLKVLNEMTDLPSLQVINFDYNFISTVAIRKAMEYGTEMLEELYIRHNQIETFTADAFDWSLDQLGGIYLDDNPIHCDCQMKWVADEEEMLERNFTVPCYYPTKHRGKNLLAIPPEQLTCDVKPIHPYIISMSLVICLPLVISLAFGFAFGRTLKRKWRKARRRFRRFKQYGGPNYTSVYTKEGEEMVVFMPKYEQLINERQEFDV